MKLTDSKSRGSGGLVNRARSQTPDVSLPAMRRLFRYALAEFCAGEANNIRSGVSERNLCQRLSFPLERAAFAAGLEGYRADVEYNRANDDTIKTIVGERMEPVTITCDLILHSRGQMPEQDNLIAIEMKRSGHPIAEKAKDRHRLMALTREPFDGVWPAGIDIEFEYVCDYVVGYFMVLDRRSDAFRIEEYVRGRLVERFTHQI